MQVSNRFHGYQLSIRFNSRQIVNRSSAKGKQTSEAYNCDEKLANKFIRKFMRKGEPFVMSINAKQRRVYSNLLLPSDFARVVDPKNCRSHCGSNLKPHFNVALPIIAATCPSSIVFLSFFPLTDVVYQRHCHLTLPHFAVSRLSRSVRHYKFVDSF